MTFNFKFTATAGRRYHHFFFSGRRGIEYLLSKRANKNGRSLTTVSGFGSIAWFTILVIKQNK